MFICSEREPRKGQGILNFNPHFHSHLFFDRRSFSNVFYDAAVLIRRESEGRNVEVFSVNKGGLEVWFGAAEGNRKRGESLAKPRGGYEFERVFRSVAGLLKEITLL